MKTDELLGELLYEYTARFTNVVEYGTPLRPLLSGELAIPAHGARFDIAFEGDVRGKLAGRLSAIDYLNVRADGRMELDLRGALRTQDGAHIAFRAGGVCLPGAPEQPSFLRENVRLTTSHAAYAWLNGLEIWALGHADILTGSVDLRGYVPA